MEDFAWFRPDIGRIIVNPDAGIHIAAIPMELPLRGTVPCPTLLVNVERKHRPITRSFVTVCQDTKVKPVIYVWERAQEWTQVGVLFVINDPMPAMLCKALPGNEATILLDTWKEVRLFFNVKIPSVYVEQFCDMYKPLRAAGVVITTFDRNLVGVGMYNVDQLRPIGRFLATDLAFTKPVIVLNPDEREGMPH